MTATKRNWMAGLFGKWQLSLHSRHLQAKLRGQQWVGTSSWQNGEAAVHRRLTLERQMNSTLLPDCAINTPAAEAEVLP